MGRLNNRVKLFEANTDEQKNMLRNKHFLDAAGISKERAAHFLESEDLEGTSNPTLIQEEVLNQVIEGSQPAKCWRNILPTVETDSYRIRIPYADDFDYYAPSWAEGGEGRENTNSYDHRDLDIEKWGFVPGITNEMLESQLFDLVELELNRGGAAMENRVNRECLNTILSNVSSGTTPEGTHIAVTDLASAKGNVMSSDWMPDTAVFHPSAYGYLLQDSNLAYVAYAGQGRTLETGEIPTLLGMEPHVCSATDSNSAAADSWGKSTDNAQAILLDSKAPLGMIGIRRGIETTEWDDILYDMHRIRILMEFGVQYVHSDAAYRIDVA